MQISHGKRKRLFNVFQKIAYSEVHGYFERSGEKRVKIIVLAGGISPEHDVSVRSGTAAAKALCRLGNAVALLDPSQETDGETHYRTDESEIEIKAKERKDNVSVHLNSSVIDACRKADKVFIALHGGIGENGTLQAIFDAFDISYTGSSARACSNAMDKIKSKLLYTSAGIPTPPYSVVSSGEKLPQTAPDFPCVIKPANGGSSIGVSFSNTKNEFILAFNRTLNALNDEDHLLIERKIKGREFSVSVLHDKAIAVTEIIPKYLYYDYKCKYNAGFAQEITPASLPRQLYEKAMLFAERAHKALGLKNFSRTDMILEKGAGRFYVLETNALPGLTETSIFPSACASVGIGFEQMCAEMLN